MDRANKILDQVNVEFGVVGAKGAAGFAGAATAMSINDIAGLIVAVLTGVYMAFQIEASWRKRRVAKAEEKEYFANKKKDGPL